MFATKSDDLSSISGPTWWEERGNSYNLNCHDHVCDVALLTFINFPATHTYK